MKSSVGLNNNKFHNHNNLFIALFVALKMLLEIVIAMVVGVFGGTIAGLTPGIHANLVGASLIPALLLAGLQIQPVYLVVFIVSMAISQTFMDFIPSILLGAPEDGTELSVLPGHQLLKKGLGFQAIVLASYGVLAGVFILAIFSILLIFVKSDFLAEFFNRIRPIIPGLLILSSLYLVSQEAKKLPAFFIFILTGILGLCVLNIASLNQPLLPLLSGLFGGSAMILSIKSKTRIPQQKIFMPRMKILKPLMGAMIASPLCGFLPGLGGGQAAIIGNSISRTDSKNFLVLVGATNSLVMGISFIALYLISKTRTGAAVFIKEIVGIPNKEILFLIIIITVISGTLSYFLTIKTAEIIISKMHKINYYYLSMIILVFLGILILFISGFLGFLVFITSTLTGIYAISSGVRRTNMMGCLIIPTILIYLLG